MRTIKRDYHGFSVHTAIKDVENLIFDYNIYTGCKLSLITGKGKIKENIIEFLEEQGVDYLDEGGKVVVNLWPEF